MNLQDNRLHNPIPEVTSNDDWEEFCNLRDHYPGLSDEEFKEEYKHHRDILPANPLGTTTNDQDWERFWNSRKNSNGGTMDYKEIAEAFRKGEDASSKKAVTSTFSTFNATDLMNEEIPPMQWAVEGLIPEGLVLLAGKQKMGKSWMALGMAIAVSEGTSVFGNFPANNGEVLYMALEDTKRRLQDRIMSLTNGRVSDNLHFATQCPPLEGGGYEVIEEWLENHPNTKMIIIDVYGKIQPKPSRTSSYQQDTKIGDKLKKLTGKYRTTILLVTHLRKMESEADPFDMIIGSVGLTGAADASLILKRSRTSKDGDLLITGRDVEENEYALTLDDDGNWLYTGESSWANMKSGHQKNIMGVLADKKEGLAPKDVAELLKADHATIRNTMRRMHKKGLLENLGGIYMLADKGTRGE